MPVYVPRSNDVTLSEEHLKGLLKAYDQDGDGRISKKDLKAAFRGLGLHFSGFKARQALHHADANKDSFVDDHEMQELVTYAAVKWGFNIN